MLNGDLFNGDIGKGAGKQAKVVAIGPAGVGQVAILTCGQKGISEVTDQHGNRPCPR